MSGIMYMMKLFSKNIDPVRDIVYIKMWDEIVEQLTKQVCDCAQRQADVNMYDHVYWQVRDPIRDHVKRQTYNEITGNSY